MRRVAAALGVLAAGPVAACGQSASIDPSAVPTRGDRSPSAKIPAARLDALRLRRPAQRRRPGRHRARRAQRRRAAPAPGQAAGNGRLVGDRAARASTSRGRAHDVAVHDDDLRADAGDRSRERPDPVGVHPARHQGIRGQRADHHRHADRRPGPRGSSTRPRPTDAIHKLSVATGREVRSGGWPVSVTLDADPREDRLGAQHQRRAPWSCTTGGYIGDAPPYQGHVVMIDRASGRITAVWNSLCSDRHTLIVPRSCPASDSAIWGRAGAVDRARHRPDPRRDRQRAVQRLDRLGRQRARAEPRRQAAAAQLDADQPGAAELERHRPRAAPRRPSCRPTTAGAWPSRAARPACSTCSTSTGSTAPPADRAAGWADRSTRFRRPGGDRGVHRAGGVVARRPDRTCSSATARAPGPTC